MNTNKEFLKFVFFQRKNLQRPHRIYLFNFFNLFTVEIFKFAPGHEVSCIHSLTSTTKASLNIINKREMSSSMSYQSVENIGPSLKFILYLCVFVSVYSNLYTMFKHVQCLESSCPVTSSYLGEGQNRRIFNDALWRVLPLLQPLKQQLSNLYQTISTLCHEKDIGILNNFKIK